MKRVTKAVFGFGRPPRGLNSRRAAISRRRKTGFVGNGRGDY